MFNKLKVVRGIVILMGSIVLILATFLGILFLGGFGKIPSKKELSEIKNENSTLVLSSEGELVGKFFEVNRTNVSFDTLPQHLVEALVATEDARFYEHEGIDTKAMFRVLFKTIMMGDESAGGGSTLSQQLAKNLFGRNKYGKLSIVVNKLKELILANRLEEIYSKEEILEFYFNTVPFGENVYGIEAAAQRYFSSSAHQLNIQQSAVLVGMLKANTRYNPRLNPKKSLDRRNVVLLQMNRFNSITINELDSIKNLPLTLNYTNTYESSKSNYFLTQVEKELAYILKKIDDKRWNKKNYRKNGLRIKTTLNYNLQKAGEKAIQQQLSQVQPLLNKLYNSGSSKNELNKLILKVAAQNKIDLAETTLKNRDLFYWHSKNRKLSVKDSLRHVLRQLHAGLYGMNPKTGAVNCYIGGIDFQHYPFDQIRAKRQMASTFKPILYAEALRSGKSACDYLSNEPITLNDFEDWSPENYDGKSGGQYSLAAALANSKNLPTVHLYFETKQTQLNELWELLGFENRLNEGPSVILGTNSVSLIELAVAYSAFANGGLKINPYYIESIETENGTVIYQHKSEKFKRILEQEVADQMNEILAKAINEGTGRSIRSTYGLKIPLAGKTGTSQDFADAWFIAYNNDLVLTSRVGASYPAIHFKNGSSGSGGRLALPIVANTLREAFKNDEFKKQLNATQLSQSSNVECDDFKEAGFIDGLFNVFKKKETSLENERKRAKKKRKVKGVLESIFGGGK